MSEESKSARGSGVVPRYFEADARGDIDAILSLFTDDAVVIDERQTWRGSAEIRAWRVGPAAKYEYTTTVTRIDRIDESHQRASGRIDGNFPGTTADLTWNFFLVDGLIERLEIAP